MLKVSKTQKFLQVYLLKSTKDVFHLRCSSFIPKTICTII